VRFHYLRIAAGALTAVAAAGLAAPALAAGDFGPHSPDQRVYDRAGVLSPSQVADLETAASQVDQAGATTIVYIRTKAAGDGAARQEARDLMTAWRVESSPGVRDGFVVLLDLTPGDPRHGSAGLVAGALHAKDGKLSGDHLQAIYDRDVKPKLAAGDVSGAVAAALDGARTALDTLDRDQLRRAQAGSASMVPLLLGGMAVFAVLVAVAFVWTVVRVITGRGRSSDPIGTPWNYAYREQGTSAADSSQPGGPDAGSDSSSGGGSF
jgi:uncharacterized membrane protein YgcG